MRLARHVVRGYLGCGESVAGPFQGYSNSIQSYYLNDQVCGVIDENLGRKGMRGPRDANSTNISTFQLGNRMDPGREFSTNPFVDRFLRRFHSQNGPHR